MNLFWKLFIIKLLVLKIFAFENIKGQTHFPSDPYYLLLYEKEQFENLLPLKSILFRPILYNTEKSKFSLSLRSEVYFNDNSPNQENMDVRYFSKGNGSFYSAQLAFNSKYLSLIAEPYFIRNNFSPVENINKEGIFSVLNSEPLVNFNKPKTSGFRNLLSFFHYKGIGFGWYSGNRWWGEGIHSSLQMSNNTVPIPSQMIGTIEEIRIGSLGIYGMYSFSTINNEETTYPTYLTSLNGQLTWYGPVFISAGFSRNYLSGGIKTNSGREWTKKDAKLLVFEGLLTSNLVGSEYTVGGHDSWDQTLSAYFTIILPKRDLKIYAEFGFNDNRMYFADLLSQPDHSMATIFGIRDYGVGKNKNWTWGFEWTNLMISYTSRQRGFNGSVPWYSKELYNYNTYYGRRWAAHSGGDSDDWYIYAGYLSNKLMIVPAINYERHGIVSHRPAEIKIEYRLDTRYKFKDIWFQIFFEKQFEAFLGFPDYYYVDSNNNPIDSSDAKLANTRNTNTIIISFSKTINF